MHNKKEDCIEIEVAQEFPEFSVSKIKTWNSCQKKYFYKYTEKLRPKKKNRALSLGGLVHECLEARDNYEDWVKVIQNYKDTEWKSLFEEERAELGDIPSDCFRLMRGYHHTYKEIDKHFTTLATEQQFRIGLPKQKIILVGIIDRILKDEDGKIWIMEHKTAKKKIPTEEFRFTDIQTAMYQYVLYRLYKEEVNENQIGGVIYDYIRTKPPTIPKMLKAGTMSKAKIDTDKWTYINELKKNGLDPEDYKDFTDKLHEQQEFYKRIIMAKDNTLVNEILRDFIVSAKMAMIYGGKSDTCTRNLTWTCDAPKCEYRDLCLQDIQRKGNREVLINQLYERREDKSDNKKD